MSALVVCPLGRRAAARRGAALLEVLVVAALVATVLAVSVPPLLAGLDGARTRAGARYLAARLSLARMLAVMRSRYVAVRFEPQAGTYRIAFYVDGNGNGVRTTDIGRGIDLPLGPAERLEDQFSFVRLGIAGSVQEVDGGTLLGPSDTPIRVGRGGLVSFSPLGTATSGTLYVRGRGSEQFAVRILGATGRIRVLRYDRPTGRWEEP